MTMIRSQVMELHPEGEGVSNMIRASLDFYEAHILDYIAGRYPVQRVIVDVGANIGNHSLYFAAFMAPTAVHAFEPLPANLRLLEANVRNWPAVIVHALALSDKAAVLHMTPVPTNMGASAITDDGPVAVAAATLDSFDFADVTLLKIDVEGHEEHVLAGAQLTIARCHPPVLVEDLRGTCGALLAGYSLVAEWPGSNALWEWAP
jgi:FkbM family methyltransferase